MTTGKLLWVTTWRGVVWGLLAGLILGAIYGVPLMWMVVANETAKSTSLISKSEPSMMTLIGGAILGALFGAPIGLIAGAMNGLLVGILTRLFFTPLKNSGTYRWTIALVSSLFTTIVVGLVLVAIICLISIVSNTWVQIFIIAIPALIAGIAAGFISRLIARWYEKESAK